MLARFHGGQSNAVWEIKCVGVVTKVGYTLSSRKASRSRRSRHQLAELPLRSSGESAALPGRWWQYCGEGGSCHHVPLVTQPTVIADWYVDQCLPQVLHAVAHGRPRTLHRGILLHHHNAPAHKAKRTPHFLAQERLQQLRHLPYSPELAPCDFFVFPQVKKLRGIRFQ